MSVLLVSLLESLALIGLFVPGIVLLFSLAAIANATEIPATTLLVFGAAGAAIGDIASFFIGYKLKHKLFESKWLKSHQNWIEQGTWFIDKWGWISVIIGRFLGPLRPIVPMLTGALGMPPQRFIPLSVLTVLFWAPAYLLPGYYTGELANLWQLQPIADRSLIIFSLSMLFIGMVMLTIYHHTHPEQLLLKGWLTRDQADRWPIHSGVLALLSLSAFTAVYLLSPLKQNADFHQWAQDWQYYRLSSLWHYFANLNNDALIATLISLTCFWLILCRKIALALTAALTLGFLWGATSVVEIYSPAHKDMNHLNVTSTLVFLLAFIANLYSNSLHGLKRWPIYLMAFTMILLVIVSLLWNGEISLSAAIASLSLGIFCSSVVRIAWRALHISLNVPSPGGITVLLLLTTVAFTIIA
ncbi:DedA family protein [Reinekea marina]|uniref:DedA family protein n=1 Tax=Reinekea marina TaxID=1310421 RepID=A0ABV7WQM6_9GAMM